ncbi:MAG: hypothetical protein U0984_03335 [Prosthecobacter sp.]|nr:hypothetical protein [Prosthecobacter sp.]
MNAPIDGLESRELIDFIVGELAREFPDRDRAEITFLVEERRAKIARPCSGGALFLEVQKLLQLREDDPGKPELIQGPWLIRAF